MFKKTMGQACSTPLTLMVAQVSSVFTTSTTMPAFKFTVLGSSGGRDTDLRNLGLSLDCFAVVLGFFGSFSALS